MQAILKFFVSFFLIVVVACAHADNNLKEFEQEFSDSVITTKITAKFTKNRNLNPLKIYVSTHDGVVSLRGHVKDRQAFVDALRLAKMTKGVKEVDTDELVIKQVNTAFTDAYITTKVEAAVLKAKVFDDESIPLVGINATTTNGTVTLSGSLKQEKAISAIIKRVTAVRGVKKIISRLEIDKEAS
ncbi:BON domain-containing protein [Legionella hackeliae]|uniref:Osmotically inducible protein n=1 Tax=Legionella hackeliae TaxID=449 RepID=A0A0A8URX2_LEGHA|nr:BON domain-containing protein [Legionella hackeliae]KTD14865.1 osmotically inducible protein Y [Legionella hackeliae]CEK09509.1 Osmotically inducible protein [Legionella hackeliae]STX49416.1 osmotically inducible protein Y [Legionella hackeliae]